MRPVGQTRIQAGRACLYCMDAHAGGKHHPPVRVLPHIKKLDDCFGQFLVRVVCDCGACREIEPEALARPSAEVVAVARPRPRGVPKNPH